MLYNVFIWFLDQENIGLDPKIMILHEVISEILEILDFEAAEISSESQFFYGNIAYMIPEGPLVVVLVVVVECVCVGEGL